MFSDNIKKKVQKSFLFKLKFYICIEIKTTKMENLINDVLKELQERQIQRY